MEIPESVKKITAIFASAWYDVGKSTWGGKGMVFFMTVAMAITAVLMLFITADVAEYKN
ncbi:hypothetical protein [Lysinibacillus odysseyi]|uniref:hypothetical protein n=1 Tax=Lysinibacillus odysseyi TaxID=202611 RepID=UPI000A7317FB|nr:hypothetical protein [Lysinibacillus odysseyi]